jgi:predicted DNA-binding protein with PD1-like motif
MVPPVSGRLSRLHRRASRHAHALLAMSCQKLGQTHEAKAELAKSAEIIHTKFSSGLDSGDAAQGFWFIQRV